MAKSTKFKFDLKMIILLCSIVLAVVAFILFFCTSAVNVVDGDGAVQSSYTSMQVAFGYSTTSQVFGSTVTTQVLNFSFLYFLAFLLLALGLVCSCLIFALKPAFAKLCKFITAGLFVAAGVFFFLAVPAINPSDNIKTVYSWLSADFRTYCRLGVGAILSGIFSVVAGAGVCATEFLKK